MNIHQATVFAARMLPTYVLSLETGAAGRYVGSHRIMAKPKKKNLGRIFRLHASGNDWTAAVLELAHVNSESRDPGVRRTALEVIKDFGRGRALVREYQGYIEPVGVDRFQLPHDS